MAGKDSGVWFHRSPEHLARFIQRFYWVLSLGLVLVIQWTSVGWAGIFTGHSLKVLLGTALFVSVSGYILRHLAQKGMKKLVAIYDDLVHTQGDILRGLATAAEMRDGATSSHTVRVGLYCMHLGKELGLSVEEQNRIAIAAQLHDIGKIAIPDSVLLKQGELNEVEREAIRKHVEYGAELLHGVHSPMLECARQIVLTHHERYDGKGYPRGLMGDQIPLVGRIAAVADVFDALIAARSYKGAWSLEAAKAEIIAQSGTQFDPKVVAAFERCFGTLACIATGALSDVGQPTPDEISKVELAALWQRQKAS